MHQLHCLQQLQKIFLPHVGNSERDPEGRQWAHNHAGHCFDYLRQSALCSADATLEGPDEEPEAGQSSLRGWGISHQCRSWDALLHFRDQYSVDP